MLGCALITICLVGLTAANLLNASEMSGQDWCGAGLTLIALVAWAWYIRRPCEDTARGT